MSPFTEWQVQVILSIGQQREDAMTQKQFKLWLACVLLGFLPACGLISHQSIYEGVRGNEKTKAAGSDKPSKLPTYDQYEKERDNLKK